MFSILFGSVNIPEVSALVTPDNFVVTPENLLFPRMYLPAIKYKNIVIGIISPSQNKQTFQYYILCSRHNCVT